MSEKRRVVITGVGAITSIGLNAPDFWTNLCAGKSGGKAITHLDTEGLASKINAAIYDYNPEDHFNPKEARKNARFMQFALIAGREALKDSGLEVTEENSPRIGTIIGCGIGGLPVMEEQMLVMETKGAKRVSPLVIPMMIPNLAAGIVSIELNLKGPNSCVVTACASATHSIGDASEAIRRGVADAMIAGGTEACLSRLAIAGFSNMHALTTRNDDPEHASRPFDRERDGFLIGEGAGLVVLEELEHAKARGARIYAEMAGYGMSGDAFHITAPASDGDGGARALKAALDSAGIAPNEVDYINAHGTSTSLNDKLETLAIKRVLGDHAYKTMISSNKSMIGHLLGAAGGVEAVASALTIYKSVVPPTINYTTPDPECDLDYVPNTAREANIRVVASNSLGFGGHNATIVLRKFEG
ncbi:MAG TPA: beta-ketoacyl-ACP synthase II [Candidatus Sumerlaeota bacterium]|nr:beta-ketoacyl-ACP synthase II [Candidatus Sumerlaeota bacterium]